MIKELGELYHLIKAMNEAGFAMLVEAAKDIASHKRYRKESIEEVKKSQFDSDIDQVLAMVNCHA